MTFTSLAQAVPPDYLERLLPALLILLGVVVLGLFVVSQVKKRMRAADEDDEPGGFTLSDLRRLHKSGQISDEEFEKAKGRVIDAAKRAAVRDATNAPADPTPPARRPARRDENVTGLEVDPRVDADPFAETDRTRPGDARPGDLLAGDPPPATATPTDPPPGDPPSGNPPSGNDEPPVK